VTSAGQHLSSAAAAVVVAALKSAGVHVALPHDGVITERSSQAGPSRNFVYHRFVQLVPNYFFSIRGPLPLPLRRAEIVASLAHGPRLSLHFYRNNP
jgi:hypothetical protein